MNTRTWWCIGTSEDQALDDLDVSGRVPARQDALDAIATVRESGEDAGAELAVYKITVTAEEDA